MMRSYIITSRASVLRAVASVLPSASLPVFSFRQVGNVTHFRDTKDSHPLKDVFPGVKRSGVTETITTQSGEQVNYEYPCQHEIWSEEECKCIEVDCRPRRSWLDSSAYWSVELVRLGFDVVSGYKFLRLTKATVLRRVLFLECAAGVPGSVGGVLRSLRSLRRIQRDRGWIQTLLQEAENERMHMLVALHMYCDVHRNGVIGPPGFLMRASVVLAQGALWNIFFFMYIVTNGRWCHRFVGHLEESAVYTYTHIIEAMESTNPENKELVDWGKSPAPEIAAKYWKLKEGATILDVFYQIRADEDNHKKVNHCLADLDPDEFNPFVDHAESHRVLQRQIDEAAAKKMKQQQHEAEQQQQRQTSSLSKKDKQDTYSAEPKTLVKKVGAGSSDAAAAASGDRSSALNKSNLFANSVKSVSVSK